MKKTHESDDIVEDSSKGMGVFKKTMLVMIAFLMIIVIGSTMVVTYPNEYSVIKQFGKIVSIKSEPGLSFKAPFITSKTTLPNTIKLYDLPASDVITKDKKTMIVDCYTLWEIADAKKFIQNLNGSVSNAENRIDAIVYNSIKNTISEMKQDEVIRSRDKDITVADNSSELENANVIEVDETIDNLEEPTENADDVEIMNLSNEVMKNFDNIQEQYGINIKTVDIKVLDLPDENKNSVYERMIAERNNIAAQYTAKGESEAQIIKNTADKEVSIMLSEANAQSEQTIAEGEAEYMRILSEAYNDPDKADFYLYVRSLDAAKKSMTGSNKTVILDESSPIAQMFLGQ